MEQSQDNGNVDQSTKQTSSENKTQKNELWDEGPMRIVVKENGISFVTLGQFIISDYYTSEEALKNCVDYETVRMMIKISLATAQQTKLLEDEQLPNTGENNKIHDRDKAYFPNQKIKDQLSDYTD